MSGTTPAGLPVDSADPSESVRRPLPLSPSSHRVARVAIDSPLPQLDHLFDYRIPDDLRGKVGPGMRVRVPLRVARRVADAYIVETAETSEIPGELSPLEELVSPVPVLTDEIYRLARAVADRAAGTASDVLRLAVPRRHVRIEKVWLESPALDLDVVGPAAAAAERGVTGYDVTAFGHRDAVVAFPGLAEAGGESVERWALTLAEQAVQTLASGRSAILAVPDYRDADQLELALGDVIDPAHVLRFDARASGASRYRTFVDALERRPRILFGNRSVIYAPAHELGLIAFWNDSDPLFAEPLAPYANARDVALLRAEQSGADLRFMAHTPSPAVERLVGLRWLTRVLPLRLRGPRVVLTPDDPVSPRIPHAAWRAASAALEQGPVLIQVAKPGSGSLDARQRGEREAADAGSTAHDLGRAFPRVRVIRADGEHTIERIGTSPALVIATRGAEPIATNGYRAILLLDGTRMLARESSRVAEDCLRWWSAAASLAADDAPVHLVGVDGDLGRALATWRLADFIDGEVAERRQLGFPPAVRVATITGASRLVAEAVDHAVQVGASVLLTEPLEEIGSGQVRTVIRFDYGHGPVVAGVLRTAVVAAAAGRRTPRRDERGFRPPPTLRVRMDDADAL